MTRDVSLAIGENLKARKGEGYKTTRTGNLSRMIAARIRVVREARGLKQDELEFRAGLARGYVSGIESGTRGRMIGVEPVVALAKALRVDLMWLITGQGRTPFGTERDGESDGAQQALPFDPSPARASRSTKKPGRKSPKRPPPKPSAPPSLGSEQPPSKPRARAAGRGTRSGRASKQKTKRPKK